MALPITAYPSFDVVLPSNKTKVKIRPMLVREEKILLMAKEGSEPSEILTAVKQIVAACTSSSSSFNVDKLPIFDIEFLFVRIRSISVSNMTQVSYQDKEDGKVYDFEINLDNVKVEFPEADKKIMVTNQDICIEMKWPEAALYDDKEFMSVEGDKMLDMLVLKCIDRIATKNEVFSAATTPQDELENWLLQLDVMTYEKMRIFVNSIPHLHYELTYKNANGHDRKIVLNSLPDFFTLA
jgi:hypothetical protein